MEPLSRSDTKPLRVLVLDDEHVIADTTAIILRQQGYDARATYNSREAIATASEWKPHLILADIMLAGSDVDGVEAALQVCAFLPDCQMLFFSGASATNELLERYRERGHVFTALPKPLHPDELLAHVAHACLAQRPIP